MAGESLFSSGSTILAGVALLIALLALGSTLVLLARQRRLMGQYDHLMRGTSGGNLESVLSEHVSLVRQSAARTERLNEVVHDLQETALQHLAIVRFNPFHNTGGDQSFSIALADGQGDGVVLSSLYARDVSRVYAKPLRQWESPYSLTEEEKQAIGLARQGEEMAPPHSA